MATIGGTLYYRPRGRDLQRQVPVVFTDDHPSSSFGLPVMVVEPRRRALGAGDLDEAAGEPVTAAVIALDTDDLKDVNWVNAAGFSARPRLRPDDQLW